jgi:hypothetical protein
LKISENTIASLKQHFKREFVMGLELQSPIYIASRLENSAVVIALRDYLAPRFVLAYDWTVHGNVKKEPLSYQSEIADNERKGVRDAMALIVILPGGRGTHIELGMAYGLGKPILLLGEQAVEGDEPAFYHGTGIYRIRSNWNYHDIMQWLLLAEYWHPNENNND